MKREHGQVLEPNGRRRDMHFEQPQGDMENSRVSYGQAEQQARPSRTGHDDDRIHQHLTDYENGDFDRNEPREEETGYDGRSHRGVDPQGDERSDERIREIVCEALMKNARIDAGEISVQVKNRVIKLTGAVRNRSTRDATLALIESEAQDCEIINELRVRYD